MKFWPSTDPRSPRYPNDMRAANEAEARKRKIALARSRGLHRIADALAQKELPLKVKPKDRQLTLFPDLDVWSWKP